MTGRYTSHPSPSAAQVAYAQCHLDDDRDIALAKAWALLSDDEIARAQRFHFDRDRTRYVRGRGFLRTVLGQINGQNPARLVFGSGAQGKPFLYNSNLAFNLSHSCNLAVLAVSQTGPLGIDLEFVDRQADIAGLAQTCLTPSERAVLADLSAAEQVRRFFTFWTAKEARMKLTGEGMSLPPRQIALDLREGYPVGYLHPEGPAAQVVFLHLGPPTAVCCLALPQGPKPIIASLSMGLCTKSADHATT